MNNADTSEKNVENNRISWSRLNVPFGDQTIPCAYTSARKYSTGTLCVFLAKSIEDIERPVRHFAKNRYPLESLLVRGADLLVTLVPWGNLNELADRIRAGQDVLAEGVDRVRAVCDYMMASDLRTDRIVLLGTSRHGWLALTCAAYLERLSGVVACETVTDWPRVSEFASMADNPILSRHDLHRLAERMPPRHVLILIGYDDQRVGTAECRHLATRIKRVYVSAGIPDAFSFQILPVKGHAGVASVRPVTYTQISGWLTQNGFLLNDHSL